MEHGHHRTLDRAKPPLSRRVYTLIGATCLAYTLSSCSDEPHKTLQSVPFNQPSSAEYYLDNNDPYYDYLLDTREQTANETARDNIDYLGEIPVAQWLNGDADYSRKLIRETIDGADENGQLSMLVIYNIPDRDLGGEAKGGINSHEEYIDWIHELSDEIGESESIVIFEPDALPGIPDMEYTEANERINTIRTSLEILRDNNPGTAIYLDAGNHVWHPPETVAKIIEQIDPDGSLVGGLSLNVSNQMSEQSESNYGITISKELGRSLKFMIDNSMNGAKNTDELRDEWCNVNGEHIGSLEDTYYDAEGVVETMFIKTPGESDGQCGESDKPAGEFDPQLLIKQVS